MTLSTPTLLTDRLRLRPFGPSEDCVVDGEVSDSWVFGLLRRDWSGHTSDP